MASAVLDLDDPDPALGGWLKCPAECADTKSASFDRKHEMADRSDATPVMQDSMDSPGVPARGIALLIQALQSLFETSAVTFVPSAATASDLEISHAAVP